MCLEVKFGVGGGGIWLVLGDPNFDVASLAIVGTLDSDDSLGVGGGVLGSRGFLDAKNVISKVRHLCADELGSARGSERVAVVRIFLAESQNIGGAKFEKD